MIITDTHVYFYTNQFSNWWSTKDIKPQFKDPNSGIIFNNTEEAFMWYKSWFFADKEICEQIVQNVNNRIHPHSVKALGRQVKNYNDKAWATVRLGFMTYVNYLKYSQNPDLAEILLNTDNRILVEASPVDKVWGVGLSEDDPLIFDEKNWKGSNLLGVALMNVRNELK